MPVNNARRAGEDSACTDRPEPGADPWNLSEKMRIALTAYVEHASQKAAAHRIGMNEKTLNAHICRAADRMQAVNALQAALMWDRFARGSRP